MIKLDLYFNISFINSQKIIIETGSFFSYTFFLIQLPGQKKNNEIPRDLINEDIHLFNNFIKRWNYNILCLNIALQNYEQDKYIAVLEGEVTKTGKSIDKMK